MSQAGIAGSTGGGGNRIITTINTFAPNATLQEFDDFLASYDGSTGRVSKLQWQSNVGNAKASAGTANNPGILALPANAGDMIFYLENLNTSNVAIGELVLGGGIVSASWIINLTALSAGGNTYRFSCGLADSATLGANSDTFVNGVYFQYTNTVNAGNWTINSTSASVTTTVNTATAVGTGFVTLSIVANAGASSVSYYVNGSLVGSAITTNIPTTSLTPFLTAKNTAGTTPEIQIDLFWISINLTNARPGLPSSSTILGVGMLIEQYVQTAISYQVLNTDAIIGVSNTAAPRTITMPASSLVTGQRWTVKDESGGAAANNITVSGNGKNIDGAATKAITTNYGAMDIYYNGSSFFII